jgi:hypothetical protein
VSEREFVNVGEGEYVYCSCGRLANRWVGGWVGNSQEVDVRMGGWVGGWEG